MGHDDVVTTVVDSEGVTHRMSVTEKYGGMNRALREFIKAEGSGAERALNNNSAWVWRQYEHVLAERAAMARALLQHRS
jgi:hypothetical protein